MAAAPPDEHGPRVRTAHAVLLCAALTLLVLVAVLPNLWYGLHDVSDITVYHGYASRIARGETPFGEAFRVEYPPLAILLFTLPGGVADPAAYSARFTLWMGLITLLAAALVAAAASQLWPRGWPAWKAAALFPLGVALTGAIIVNRYDAALALVIAALLLCLVRRWYVPAAAVLGIGFALKLTPAVLLPLVLIVAGPPRRWLAPLLGFAAAALAPFLEALVSAPAGVWHVFRYHLERPLQIESVLGTPLLLGQLLGAEWAGYGYSHGSHSLEAPGTGVLAAASGMLTLLAVAGVYVLAWRRRARLAASAQDQALVVFALLLALMAFSKVLSPQFMIWLLPAWAVVAARDPVLAALGALVLLLTQVEFPALYWRLLDMQPGALAVVVARNLLLLALWAAAMGRLWRLYGRDGAD